jgi:hypothetical protein
MSAKTWYFDSVCPSHVKLTASSRLALCLPMSMLIGFSLDLRVLPTGLDNGNAGRDPSCGRRSLACSTRKRAVVAQTGSAFSRGRWSFRLRVG